MVEDLVMFLLEQYKLGKVTYWSNEEPEAFIIRNKALIDEFDIGLSWNDKYYGAKSTLVLLPPKFRNRNIGDTVQQKPRPPIERQTDPEFLFTIVIDETKVGHELIIQSLDGSKSYTIGITSMSSNELKDVFTPIFDNAARQTQIKN